MQQLTDEGHRIVDDLARRHGFSSDAVLTMLLAVSAGYGNQAQFQHPEFGGMGQWSAGGMIMIGDMFNNYLKGRVGSLCQELATLIQGQPLFAMPAQSQSQSQGGGWQGQSGGGSFQQQGNGGNTGNSGSSLFVPNAQNSNWWPADLGSPGSTGAQNNLRYAYFPGPRRLAIDVGGQVSVYDTGNHQIGGFSQQQSGDQSITFTSQFGLVRVLDLPLIAPKNSNNTSAGSTPPQPVTSQQPAFQAQASQPLPMQPLNFQPLNSQPLAPQPFMPTPQWTQQASTPEAPNQQAPFQQSPAGPTERTPKTHAAPDEIFSLIEKVADLHKKGVLTDSEYESKKAELLGRL